MSFIVFPRRLAAGIVLTLIVWVGAFAQRASAAESLIYSGHYDSATQTFDSLTFVNPVLGWDDFFYNGFLGASTVIGNVEGGYIWFGHEVFNRPPDQPGVFMTFTNTASGAINQFDYHATLVGNVLAGSGYVAGSNPASFTYVGLGMAPFAKVWSGAIATAFSSSDLGAFETTTASILTPYKAFFNGITVSGTLRKADVINSSWGGYDPAGSSGEVIALDGLARQNRTVAFVVAAGNSGTAAVAAPASGFNNISVGSVGGASFLQPSAFSAHGPSDFYNPETLITITGARAGVDIAAPGEEFALAEYLGPTGSLGATTDPQLRAIIEDPSPTNQYFLNLDGTSFSAPFVAGAISLLKDVANTHPVLNLNAYPDAQDTRVIKSVLMAGAKKTVGWDNGQSVNQAGTIVTTQALDYATGAGLLDLTGATETYFGGTTDVAGSGGGAIQEDGWDFGTVALNASTDYVFTAEFAGDIELTISLNWFSNRSFDNATDIGSDLSFADLNLELWQVTNGVFVTMVAQSATVYNNTEFLRLELADAGDYGLRVTFIGLVYDLTPGVTSESYGLAWSSQIVPEPGSIFLILSAGLVWLFCGRVRPPHGASGNASS